MSRLTAQVIEEEFGADYPWLPFESIPELWCIKEGMLLLLLLLLLYESSARCVLTTDSNP